MIGLLLAFPTLLALLCMMLRSRVLNRVCLPGAAAFYAAAGASHMLGFEFTTLPGWMLGYFAFDSIGSFFYWVMVVVFAAASFSSISYFRAHQMPVKREAAYAAGLLFFMTAMSGVILAAHLALLWVFLEATTLCSAVLIYFERKKSSLEAAWKYVYICSIGITLAFVGIILLSIGGRGIGSLFFSDLLARAAEINPFWLKISFAFIFIGFGTKIGIVPLHAWLPDAHSEAPPPVSALLSGALLNTAFLGLLRVHEVLRLAGLGGFSEFLFMLTGFLSLLISSVFISRVSNYKRMLAYSSIENMGIMFVGVALGPQGIFAALLHTLAHSLSKASLFLTSGNIVSLYGTKRIDGVQGLLQRDARSGWLWIASLLSIVGIPPCPIFISKFLLLSALWSNGLAWLTVPFFLLTVTAAFGLGNAAFKMAFGGNDAGGGARAALTPVAYVPQAALLLILWLVGANMPAQALSLLTDAARFFR